MSSALATCELKFNLDFYRSARVSETALHLFADGLADGLRKRQISLSGRRTAAFKGAKINVKRGQAEPVLLPRYLDVSESSGFEQLSQTSWVSQ
jgi:hypothetical protein